MINVLIVDDEPLARARVRRLLTMHPNYHVVGDADNGEQAVTLCKELQPDIVLLDINMPKLSGLEVAKALKLLAIPPAVVFLTAHSEHALEAFELAVDGYLVKPITEQALTKTLLQLSKLNRTQVNRPVHSHITYQLAGAMRRVNIDDVVCCVAEQKYTRLIFVGGEAIIEHSLKQLESTYSQQLLRIHRNTLVNKLHIQSLHCSVSSGHHLIMRHYDEPLTISRRALKTVKQAMGE
ncbi:MULTISPECIES: LytR/AlgR family response regulator transcription factor [Pseudoalteromonas]|jgi:two-component system response regulator AlgR|uniref:LytR/AlgR family response regulator transcription factor n=1 Tax=Pseudoalteromonas TaxID=53246 RepID=UPI001A7ECB06|nr:LytTR family DNA-binding domain-containing protein [Pseudoalteromonas sp. bablab_jr011]